MDYIKIGFHDKHLYDHDKHLYNHSWDHLSYYMCYIFAGSLKEYSFQSYPLHKLWD